MTKTKTEAYTEIERGEFNPESITIASNCRKHFEEKALKELADSIGKVGVLQAIILRPAEDGGFILVAGERRLRAAIMAGLKVIPGRVLELTEEQALEVQALENLHRKDLSPIEEANAFKILLDSKGHTLEEVKELAARVDKSVNYVYRSLRLLELPDKVLSLIDSGELTPAHGHQLLRVDATKRGEVIEDLLENTGDGTEFMTARDLQKEIEGNSADLSTATFPTSETYGNRMACNICPHNSSNQASLFDGGEGGKCILSECYQHKTACAIEEKHHSLLLSLPGAKDLGVRKADYSGNVNGKPEWKVYEDGLPKELKKAFKATPAAFGVVTLQPSYGDDVKVVVVCHDPVTALGEKPAEKNKTKEHDYKRDNFVQEQSRKALFSMVASNGPTKMTAEHMRMVLRLILEESYSAREIFEHCYMKADQERDAAVAEMKEKALPLAIIVASLATRYNEPELIKDIATLGIDAKGVLKEAKAEALRAYKEQQKTAKKAKPSQEDEE